jgi:hypothetical protein
METTARTTASGRRAALLAAPAILAAAALLTTGCGGSGAGDTAQSRLLSAAAGPQAPRQWQSLGNAMARCRTATITVGGVQSPATIRPISFPRVGSGSSAYAWTFTVSGVPVGDDLILFHAGSYEGYLTYASVGSPLAATVRAFAAAAAGRRGCPHRSASTPWPVRPARSSPRSAPGDPTCWAGRWAA